MCLHRVDTFAGVGLFSALVAYGKNIFWFCLYISY